MPTLEWIGKKAVVNHPAPAGLVGAFSYAHGEAKKEIREQPDGRCLHFAYYNFIRNHLTPRLTLAMAAGITDRVWILEELI